MTTSADARGIEARARARPVPGMLRWSTPPVTSSRSSRRGRVASARASSRRLRWPVESTRAWASALSAEADAARVPRAPRVRASRGIGRLLEGADHHVLEHGHLGEGLELLERARHAEPADLVGTEPGDAAGRPAARCPRSAGWKPVSRSKSVDLPAPLGPMMPTSSPGATWKEMSLLATRPPKRLVTPRTSSKIPSPPWGEGRARGLRLGHPVRRRPRWASAMMPPGWITEMTMIRKP